MIVNLTQHAATKEQKQAGVVDSNYPDVISTILTFNTIPSREEMLKRANDIVLLALISDAPKAMIGGAPFFMAILENALIDAGITPLYAFSKRESVETTLEDGSVVKTNVFKHLGFVSNK